MKLSIKDNSVRMHLTRSEVAALRANGIVASKTCFPGGRELRYQVESSPASVNPGAFFSENTVTVRLPESTVLQWAATEQVSMLGEQRLGDGDMLKILVEKDDACPTEREGDDETDNYPHPSAGGC